MTYDDRDLFRSPRAQQRRRLLAQGRLRPSAPFGRRPLYPGARPVRAPRPAAPWYLRLLDPRLYLRMAVTLVALAAVGLMFFAGAQHLREQWSAPPERAEGVTSAGQLAGQALSLDNLEDTLIGLYLRIQQPVLSRAMGTGTVPIYFTIEPGETAGSVAERLKEMGLISDAGLFTLYLRYHGIDRRLEAGDFELTTSMTMPEIAQALQRAIVREVTITIPEGWRAEQVAEFLEQEGIMEASAFMAAVRAGDPVALGLGRYPFLDDRPPGASLEGYLFPDTYRIPARAKPADLLGAMLDNFDEKVTPDLRAAAASSGLSLFQAVTLASIIEREAVQADERPLIASVYRNRLANACPEVGGAYLQADPTVQYARGRPGEWWWKPASVEEYQYVQHPYNTYLYPGLPPGPIASPGLSALEAAIRPAETQYCFFVATGQDGRHVFARTYAEHQINMQMYQP
ncbi:MAG: endolytic transglycosylase MltG [Caldilineales bacterium]|nr:endolytic transglycosylase MltG [Caldilineales bacterium]MDW8318650.1 endolytic transglycosylase MltG [Anaerolineae bacterium]